MPAVYNEYMPVDIDFISFVLIVFTACGISEAVVAAAANRPSISVKSIGSKLQNRSTRQGRLFLNYCHPELAEGQLAEGQLAEGQLVEGQRILKQAALRLQR